MHELPEALIERLKNRQAILVAGLGCSELAHHPGWNSLADRLVGWLEERSDQDAVRALLHKGQLAHAMAYLHDVLHAEVLAEAMREAYPMSAEVPEVIRQVAHAPWRGLVTTGLDALWATALDDDEEVRARTAFAAHAATLEAGRGRFLLQIFGRSDVPASLCLSPAEIPGKVVTPGAAKYLAHLHQKLSFVFVGFAPADPDLAMLAGTILGATTSNVPHFFVAPDLSASDGRLVRATLGLQPVSLGADLPETLSRLAEAASLAGGQPAEDEVEAWLELLATDPDNDTLRMALDRGLTKLRDHQEWERLVTALLSRAELVHDAVAQAAILREAGLILENELGAPDRAAEVLLMALNLQPSHRELMADAKRVAEKAGQWDTFVKEVGRLEMDNADSTQIALEMGRLCATDAQRLDQAIVAFEKVLARDPESREAHATLAELYTKAERWDSLRTLHEKALARDPRNAEVRAQLEDLYRKTGKQKELVAVLTNALDRTPDDHATFIKLETIYREIEDWQALTDMVERLTEREPANVEALAKLDELYRRTQRWKSLAELLERRALRKTDLEQARGLRMERASLMLDRLDDIEGALRVVKSFVSEDVAAAEELYTRALDRYPQHAGLLGALADLCRRKGEFGRAAKFAVEGANQSKNPLEQARLLAEAGELHLDQLQNASTASDLFARALAADPEQITAAQRLADLREARQDWAGVEPLLETLLRKTSESDPARANLHARMATCARALGKLDKALDHTEAAARLQPDIAGVARTLADLHFDRQAWAEARQAYEDALHLEDLSAADRIQIQLRLGHCAQALGDSDAAVSHFQAAVDLEPEDRENLQWLISLRMARQEWHEAAALKRQAVTLCESDEDKAQAWEEIGDLLREQLDDRTGAMNAYNEALAVQPARRQALYKTLDHYTADKQWPQAVEVLSKVAALETDPAVRAKCRYSLAVIHRDELKDRAKAIELFNQVLEDHPTWTRAFEALERLYVEAKDWKELARAYRKQLRRLPADAPVESKLRLWDALAEVVLKHLDNRESASVALEVASSLDPDNLARQEQLAQLYYEMGPSAADKAIAQHQMLIAKRPDRLESYRALAALYFQAGAHDKMWCVAGAMTLLGKADPPLRTMYEGYRPTQLPNAAGKMTDDLWRKVLHPNEDPYVSALLSLLSPALAMSTAQPHKVMGFDRNARVDLAGPNWAYSSALRYIATTIESPLPDVFVRGDVPTSLSILNLRDKNTLVPTLIVGCGFQWTGQSEIIFDLAKRLVFLRPERFPRFAVATPAALEIALRAGLRLGGVAIGAGDHPAEVEEMTKHLDGLLPLPLKAELKGVAKQYFEARGDKLSVPEWIVASDLTAARAALALSGDVVAAGRVLNAEPLGQSFLSVQERINDLVAFSVSEEHFAVRAALGLQVDVAPLKQPGVQPRLSHAQIKVTR
jgi:tetratricopeptide (TPR) repeat protein